MSEMVERVARAMVAVELELVKEYGIAGTSVSKGNFR